MSNPINLSAPSIVIAVTTFIGTLSGLEASALVISVVITVAVGVSAVRRNLAQTEYFQSANRKINTRSSMK